MTANSNTDNSLLRHLRELAARQNVSPALSDYLDSYFADADLGNFADANPEELLGAALQHYRHGQQRSPGAAAIAFYTPDFDRHGWHSAHAVIDIVTDDMPFLVDSITMTVYRQGLTIHRLLHPLLGIARDAAGVVRRCARCGSADTLAESWIHLEIDRISDPRQIDALRTEIAGHLADVRAAVDDHPAMREKVAAAIADLQTSPQAESGEIAEFLRWIGAGNFVFLGYAHYHADRSVNALRRQAEGSLGLLRRADHPHFASCLADIPCQLLEVARRPSALTLLKADAHSTVHRPTYLDFIGVVYHDATGEIVGEHVFVGLYAMHVYHVSSSDIPVVRSKVAAVRSACAFAPGGYRDKALVNVLETYPREELIEIGAGDLERIARGIVMLQEHPCVRVFLRDDPWGRYVSALVYMPRDRFETTVRRRITALLAETLHADSVDFFLQVGESRLARLHLIARLPAGKRHDYSYDAASFEREVARIVRGWHDELLQHLIEHYGEERGNALARRYATALPLAYQDQVPAPLAVSDLDRLDAAERSGRLEVKLNAPTGDDGSHQHIKLFLKDAPRPLTAVLPVFDNMGVTVLSEQAFRLSGPAMHIADFAVRLPQAGALDDEATRAVFVALLEGVLRDDAENDGFNRLALLAGLDGWRINVLRAYCRYLRQAGLPFSQNYIERCLAAQPAIARLLADLFSARLAPRSGDDEAVAAARAAAIGDQLDAALAEVGSLDDDRILSGFRAVIEATLRTNAWQGAADGQAKAYLSFKMASKQIPFLPKPVPLYEVFVYSARMEGIHLRGARVARGGLRWSDRMEDYRTEGLGLVKAQTAKNAVIVPLGAKGCFVGKRLPPPGERDAYLAEGIACYSTFIRGLLDLTDNLVDGRVVPPNDVCRRDGDDPYLVVAADKGTASFSDIANAIALEYGFWLGDAFASGGSAGYDHKKMGITARGAWEAVKRHFRELGRDTQSQPFTVVGIGDMSGDVFGNAMLLSQQIRLVAAFDHRHVFIDPDPDAATSFGERQRIFALPRSSWDDYDRSLISAGGGVWPRSAKSIALSPQLRQCLGASAEQMTPNELISAILRAPVDLLYNGGIGTYVKSSHQSHQDANDRNNDGVRVDGAQLRARVVGEGGNLGMTQKGRIEYALAGGRLYTDAIDNSAGVDCSDHEVNIKILLSTRVASGEMTVKQRDRLLASMTDDVAQQVLADNYQQTQAIALETAAATELLGMHAQLMRRLEAAGTLERSVEFLPDDKALAEREQMRIGLTPPEIAVLLAYAKIALKEDILATSLSDAPELQQLLIDYFPSALVRECAEQLAMHPLRREIIVTQLVNRLVNRMGSCFVMQIADETGADTARVVAAWYAASELLGAPAAWRQLESLDLKQPVAQQMALMSRLRATVAAASREILAAHTAATPIAELIGDYRDAVAETLASVSQGLDGVAAVTARIEARTKIVDVFELVDLARSAQRPLGEVADCCARFDASLDLAWLSGAIARLPADNRWQARARSQLAGQLRALRQRLLARAECGERQAIAAARAVVDELKRNAPQDLAMLSAGLAEVGRLLEA